MQAPPTPSLAFPPRRPAAPEEAEPAAPRGGGPGITWWMWPLAGALFLAYTTLSLRLHQRMLTNAFDLAIFEQVVRSYAAGHLPVSEVKGPDFPYWGTTSIPSWP